MPVFSKMMGSYPFNLIRGLGVSSSILAGGVGLGAATGAYRGRREGVGGMAGGAIRGGTNAAGLMGVGALGYLGYKGVGGISGMRTFGRNMANPGVRSMYGGLLRNKGEAGLASMMSKAAKFIRR
jgi:hypothetical protein